ncbi:MAG: exonuclease domain-containing protein [Bacteroidales bacterium]|nr:exonuclease domain-containing protein [Bacteroidales bacterium]
MKKRLMITGDVNMENVNFVAIDFETANRHEDVCQIGVVKVEKGIIVKEYSHYIQPPNNYFEENYIRAHGITPEITKDSLNFSEVWDLIKCDLEHQTIVAHSAISADERYLKKNFEKHGVISFGIQPFECTYRIYGYGLAAICNGFGMPYTNHHDALFDAQCCAKFYLNHLLGIKPDLSKMMSIKPKVRTPKQFADKKISSDLLQPDKSVSSDALFFNRKIVITGDFDFVGRDSLSEKLKSLGADIDTSISKYISYVAIGENPGPAKMSKVADLRASGQTIILLYESDLKLILEGDVENYRILDEKVNFKVKPKRLIDYKSIVKDSRKTLKNLTSNDFSLYAKEAYFTKLFSGNPLYLYQSIGNIGCSTNLWNDLSIVFEEQGSVVSLIIVGEMDLENMKNGINSNEIEYIQKRIDMPNSSVYNVAFLTVTDLIQYLESRFTSYSDVQSLSLIEKYNESIL